MVCEPRAHRYKTWLKINPYCTQYRNMLQRLGHEYIRILIRADMTNTGKRKTVSPTVRQR